MLQSRSTPPVCSKHRLPALKPHANGAKPSRGLSRGSTKCGLCRSQKGDIGKADPDYCLTRQIFDASTKYKSLARVEADIKDYCERCTGEEEQAACMRTLATLHAEHEAATAALTHPEQAAEAAEKLDRLDDMARQLAECGGTKVMVNVLDHMQARQRRAASPPVQGSQEAADAESAARALREEADKNGEQREQRLRNLFDAMDRDKNGTLNIAELREAMDELGDHLDGAMVSKICSALDIHGRVTFEEFCVIVDAEAIRSRTPEAARLRALLHHASDDAYSKWIKNLD